MSSANLHVVVSPLVTDEILREAFSPFGEILSCKVMKDLHTCAPRGFAFVKYQTHSDAEKAVAAMNKHSLCGAPLQVQFAKHDGFNVVVDSEKVYIRNIPQVVFPEQLQQDLSVCGTVKSVCIRADSSRAPKGPKWCEPTNVAFVEFANVDEAKKCIALLNNANRWGSLFPLQAKMAETESIRAQRLRSAKCTKAQNTTGPLTVESCMAPPYQPMMPMWIPAPFGPCNTSPQPPYPFMQPRTEVIYLPAQHPFASTANRQRLTTYKFNSFEQRMEVSRNETIFSPSNNTHP
jgi:RNA recognition motif-containing protein